MIFKKGEWEHLGKFYVAHLIQVITSVIMPFIIIYFRDLNLSFTQISIVLATYGVATFLFEIPTGAFADGYSRKFSVLIGIFAMALIILMFAFATSFWSILVLWSLLGIASTFESGAYSSWVVSNLKKKKKEKLQQEYFIKLESIFALGVVIAPLLGTLVVKLFSYPGLWIVFGLGMLINGLLLSFIPEHYISKKTSLRKALKNNFKLARKGFKFVKHKKQIFYFLIAGVFVAFMDLGSSAWQPFIVELGAPVHYLGYFYSICAALVVGVPFLVRRFSKWKVKRVLIFSEIISAVFFASVLLLKPGMFWYVLVPFIVFSVVDTFNAPLVQNYLHKHIKESIRATVISINSMISVLTGTIVVLISGPLLDMFPLKFVIAAGSVFVFGAVYFYNKMEN